ncbi:RNA binding motif-containing protein [Oopsacas minuta]|uniref:RNA binding motif-containing protein n=1 Tax=Oopsacas minuta TaxID=111878 RepID=A0AAV7JNA2_9METZ|nr:RNA binding motif-containing protein [Oopsacas minuta]
MAQNDFEAAPIITEPENFENSTVSRGDRPRPSGPGGVIPTKLYVKRIPEAVTSKELNDLFATYGTVTECAIIRSYAFVHFSNGEEAAAALAALNGYRFMGVNLEIEQSKSHSRSRRMNNRRDVYRNDDYGGRRDRDRSPVYSGYGGEYSDYGSGYGYSDSYGGRYMGGHYRSPNPRRGYPPAPRYMAPQYNTYPPAQNYQPYGPPRPRGPPPPLTSYYPTT